MARAARHTRMQPDTRRATLAAILRSFLGATGAVSATVTGHVCDEDNDRGGTTMYWRTSTTAVFADGSTWCRTPSHEKLVEEGTDACRHYDACDALADDVRESSTCLADDESHTERV